MKNILLIFSFLIFFACQTVAQRPVSKAFEAYADFNTARLEGQSSTALEMGEALLDSLDQLTPKQQISFYNSMGSLYEANKAPEKAIPYYEKVIAAQPGYYVAHLALANILLKNVYDLQDSLSKSVVNHKNDPVLRLKYNAAALTAVKHLEYVQACDPDDKTLSIIKMLYKNMNDTKALNTLNSRLAELKNNCLDILMDN